MRLSEHEYELLNQQGQQLGVGPSTYARTLIRRSLLPPEASPPRSRMAEVSLEARVSSLEQAIARLIAQTGR